MIEDFTGLPKILNGIITSTMNISHIGTNLGLAKVARALRSSAQKPQRSTLSAPYLPLSAY
jgi:hypothetical protein